MTYAACEASSGRERGWLRLGSPWEMNMFGCAMDCEKKEDAYRLLGEFGWIV